MLGLCRMVGSVWQAGGPGTGHYSCTFLDATELVIQWRKQTPHSLLLYFAHLLFIITSVSLYYINLCELLFLCLHLSSGSMASVLNSVGDK